MSKSSNISPASPLTGTPTAAWPWTKRATSSTGDKIIAALAVDMKGKGELPGDAAVVTVMSNLGFFRFCEQNGISPVSTKVGDRYVLEEMVKNGYAIGGEQSGAYHLPPARHHRGRPALRRQAALHVPRTGAEVSSRIGSMMERYPQVLINVRADAEQKARYTADTALAEEIRRPGNPLAGTAGFWCGSPALNPSSA